MVNFVTLLKLEEQLNASLIFSANPCPFCGEKAWWAYYLETAKSSARPSARVAIALVDIPLPVPIVCYAFVDECMYCGAVTSLVDTWR